MDHPNKVNRHFFLWLLAHISVSHLQHLLFSSDLVSRHTADFSSGTELWAQRCS